MRLVFAGLDRPLELEPGVCSTLEVENQALFVRLVRSLMSGEGRYADEPYSVWEQDEEIKPKGALLVIDNPLRLPWDELGLMGSVLKRIEREYLEDEDLRRAVEGFQSAMASQLAVLGMGMNADFGFGQEWDFRRYLKFMGFGVSYQESKSFLDNQLNFLSLTLDSGDKRVLVFVNLKTFLSENDLRLFLEQVFYQKTRILLLENKLDESVYVHENKRHIDLDFVES